MNEHSIHYETMELQPIRAIEAWLKPEQLKGFYLGQFIKYGGRYNMKAEGKGGLPDLKKARDYLNWLIDLEEKLINEYD